MKRSENMQRKSYLLKRIQQSLAGAMRRSKNMTSHRRHRITRLDITLSSGGLMEHEDELSSECMPWYGWALCDLLVKTSVIACHKRTPWKRTYILSEVVQAEAAIRFCRV